MRKSLFITFLLLVTCLTVRAQRFALIDMEYILRNIPAYESANQQLEQSSKKWQAEVDKLAQEAKQASLMRPLQDEIYEAVKEIATAKGYAVVTDRASASSIIFASPEIDISNEVLAKLGYGG